MYKVYFSDIKPIEVDKMSDVINYLVCHNAIGYEKLNNKSAYEILEEKYKRALKEKNKYKKIVRELEKWADENLKDTYAISNGIIFEELLNIIKGDKNEDKR